MSFYGLSPQRGGRVVRTPDFCRGEINEFFPQYEIYFETFPYFIFPRTLFGDLIFKMFSLLLVKNTNKTQGEALLYLTHETWS